MFYDYLVCCCLNSYLKSHKIMTNKLPPPPPAIYYGSIIIHVIITCEPFYNRKAKCELSLEWGCDIQNTALICDFI